MDLLVVLLVTALLSVLLSRALHAAPWVFYAAGLVLSAAFICQTVGAVTFPLPLRRALSLLMQKGTLGFALFAVVMYVGALPGSWRVATRLRFVRGELSILACLLICAHVAMYAPGMLGRAMGGAAISPWLTAAALVAALLVLLLALLGVTSVKAVRKTMRPSVWKAVQKWAYAFYGLTYAHVALALLPSALRGGLMAQESLLVYTGVFGIYAVMRVRKGFATRCRVSDAD